MATTARTKPELDQAEDRARRVLNLLVNLTDTPDGALAERCGLKRQALQDRRKGNTRIRIGDVDAFAEAFGVNVLLFSLDPSEALHYLADNHPDLVMLSSGWLTETAA